jgi:hypothetical protein
MKPLDELIDGRKSLNAISVFVSPRGGFEANVVDAKIQSGFFIGHGKTASAAIREAFALKETNSRKPKKTNPEDDV